ncbi:MAG TPA: CHAT domain-containing protein [Isosphaeraceae bacterium]|jgi:hypothetical protein
MSRIKIVLFAANPFGDLRLDQEIQGIQDKLDAAHVRRLKLVPVLATRPGELIDRLRKHQPIIVQFSGHGMRGAGTGPGDRGAGAAPTRDLGPSDSEAGQIILVGEGGRPKPVSQSALVDLFRVRRDNIRIVVLNACYTRDQAEAISRVVDCVIGTSRAITDDAARIFAARFYRSLADRQSVRVAFEESLAELRLEGHEREADIPQLLTREGVDASKLFLVEPQDRTPPSPGSNDGEQGQARRQRIIRVLVRGLGSVLALVLVGVGFRVGCSPGQEVDEAVDVVALARQIGDSFDNPIPPIATYGNSHVPERRLLQAVFLNLPRSGYRDDLILQAVQLLRDQGHFQDRGRVNVEGLVTRLECLRRQRLRWLKETVRPALERPGLKDVPLPNWVWLDFTAGYPEKSRVPLPERAAVNEEIAELERSFLIQPPGSVVDCFDSEQLAD